MTFPLAPLPVVSQFFIDGAWVDATTNGESDFRYSAGITITGGRKNEQAKIAPTIVDATLNNHSGKWSDENPMSPYYGKLPTNTLMRHYILGNSFMQTWGGSFPDYGCLISADHADYDITGDIDIRVDCQFREWKNQGLVAKYITTGNISWALYIDELKRLRFTSSNNGTAIAVNVASSALTTPDGDRLAVRATLDVDNGAAGKTVTFYTAPTIDGPWTQLGGAVTTGGTTTIFASNADIELGAVRWLGPYPSFGKFFAFQMYASLNGSDLRANINLRNVLTSGTTYIDGTTGKSWFAGNFGANAPDFAEFNPSRVVPASVRCCVEVSQWPQEWDSTGQDIYTPIQGAGILRRLTQGKKPDWSPWRRGILSVANLNNGNALTAYWPCEDREGAQSVASAIPGVEAMVVDAPNTDDVVFEASRDEFLTNFWVHGFGVIDASTKPLPNLAGGGRFIGLCPPSNEGTGNWIVQFVAQTNAVQNGADIVIASWETPGSTFVRWEVLQDSGGLGTEVATYDAAGTRTVRLSTVNSILGSLCNYWVGCEQSGGNVFIHLRVGNNVEDTDTIAGTAAKPTRVIANPNSQTVTGVSGFYFGHYQVWASTFAYLMGYAESGQVTQIQDDDGVNYYPFYRYLNERASDRIERICLSQNVNVEIIGDRRTTPRMGPQPDKEFMDLLYECEDIDGGILYEDKSSIGFIYICRSALLNQLSNMDLDYAAKHLIGEFRPSPDDLIIRNDVEVKSTTGSSARSTLTTGKLSTLDPPDGVGVYDESREVNPATDTELQDIADLRRHIGTWNEARFPSVQIGLHRSDFLTNAGLKASAYGMDVGRFFTVDNVLSPPMAPNLISLLAQGYKEVMATFIHTMTFNCVPSGPYQFAFAGSDVLDNEVERVAADGDMVLSANATDVATTLNVHSVSGDALWATDADDDESTDDFPMDAMVSGERVTITDVNESITDLFDVADAATWPGWTSFINQGAVASVSGGLGIHTHSATNTLLGLSRDTGTINHRTRTFLSISALATGAAVSVFHFVRGLNNSNYYMLTITFNTNGNVAITGNKRVAGALTSVPGQSFSTKTIGTYGAGTVVAVDIMVIGANPTKIWAKAWLPATQDEPIGWNAYTEDSDLDTGNLVGTLSRRETGNTNANLRVEHTDYHVVVPQSLTVVRSVNGIVKAQTAGNEIEVVNAGYVGR